MRQLGPLLLFLWGLVLAVQPGQRVPDFALLDAKGNLVTLSTLKKPAV